MAKELIYMEIKKYLMFIIGQNTGMQFKLPSEQQLCIRFKCSRPPVRRAIEELKNEGLVYSLQGSGVFLKPTNENLPFYKQKNICLIMPHIESNHYRSIFNGISDTLFNQGFNLFSSFTRDVNYMENIIVDSAIGKLFDGLLIAPVIHNMPNQNLKNLIKKKKPILFVGRSPFGLSSNGVYLDDFSMISTVMDYLSNLGHKNIGFICEETTIFDNYYERIRAYRKFCVAKGSSLRLSEINFYPEQQDEISAESIDSQLDVFVKKNHKMTALVLPCIALKYLISCLKRNNIALDAFALLIIDRPDNLEEINEIKNALYIEQHPECLGRKSAEAIINHILTGIPPESVIIKPEILPLEI